jgi:hypothetical protein
MISFDESMFVCSKPLQFLMCAGIVQAYGIEHVETCVVTRSISDADGFLAFARSSRYESIFDRVHEVPDHRAAAAVVRHARYDNLFIEDDRASMYYVFAPLKRRTLAVFEEGVGTYCADVRSQLSPLRKLRWTAAAAITGCGLRFGYGQATDHVFVQFPEAYARLNPRAAHKALPVPPLRDELARSAPRWDEELAATGFRPPKANSRAALVLGTWGGASPEVLAHAVATYDRVYYKPHPHDGAVPKAEGVDVFGASWIPAEVYIDRIARACRSLSVVHFSSSAELNTQGRSNVTFHDLLGDPRVIQVRDMIADLST